MQDLAQAWADAIPPSANGDSGDSVTVFGAAAAGGTMVFLLLVAAAALVTRRFRVWAGIALALYSLAVWPANIKHAFEGIHVAIIPDTWWYHAPRLALQPIIIWWALYCSGAVDWPWRRR